jgi:predicted phage terminase large subunit-like protein
MARVKRELETNDVLIYDYGIKQGASWGQEHIQVLRGDGHRVDFYSVGKRSSIRGSRGTVVIDDPQNVDDCRSEIVLSRDLDWFLEDVIPIIIGDQRLIFIGTVMSPLSLLAKVKQMPDFKVLSFPAENPVWSGKSAWPEQWPDEFLAQRKNMLGMERYGSEYLCVARVPGNPVFKSEWFPHYEADSVQFRDKIAREIVYRVTGFDGAESKDSRADYTAIVTLGVTYGKVPDIYVLDVQRDRWTTKEGAERLFIVFDNQKQNKSIVESRCKPPNKDAIVEEIEERQRVYGKHINMYQVKPLRDKVTRAHAIQSICQEGRVYINRHDPAQQGLLEELTMFTGDQNFHDDRVDAFVMALTDVKQRGHSQGIQIKSALQGAWA